jgi:hypothetical protein
MKASKLVSPGTDPLDVILIPFCLIGSLGRRLSYLSAGPSKRCLCSSGAADDDWTFSQERNLDRRIRERKLRERDGSGRIRQTCSRPAFTANSDDFVCLLYGRQATGHITGAGSGGQNAIGTGTIGGMLSATVKRF